MGLQKKLISFIHLISYCDIDYKNFHTAIKEHCIDYFFHQWAKYYEEREDMSPVFISLFFMLCSYGWIGNLHLCLSSQISYFETFFLCLVSFVAWSGNSKLYFLQPLSHIILVRMFTFYIISATADTQRYILQPVY